MNQNLETVQIKVSENVSTVLPEGLNSYIF